MTTAGGSAVAMIKGVVPAEERTVTDLASQVEEGQLDALDHVAEGSLPPVLLGRDLASTLGVGVGDVVSVTSPNGRLSPYGMVPSVKKFRVAGTVYSGLYEFDAQWAYIPLSVAQRLFTEGRDSASLVEVRIDDIYAVKQVAPRILAALGDGYLTTDWIMMNQSLFSALWLRRSPSASPSASS